MNKLLAFLVALGLVLPISTEAQDAYLAAVGRYVSGDTVSFYQTAEDTDVALFVRYVGSTVGTNTIEINAGGDLLFVEGGSADASVICPSGGTGGTIDVSNGDCNTMGEVVDICNADANWVCVLHGALRSDTSTDYLLDQGPTDAGEVAGVAIEWDSDVANMVTHVVTTFDDLRDYTGNERTGDLLTNPYAGTRANVIEVDYNVNFGTAGTIQILSVLPDNRAESETVTTIFSLGAADNSETLFDRKPFGVFGRKDEKLIFRFVDSGTIAGVALVSGYGIQFSAR